MIQSAAADNANTESTSTESAAAENSLNQTSLTLKLLLPTKVLLEEQVTKVVAEAQNGSFCLLPNHIDFVAALVPGILTFTQQDTQKGSQESDHNNAKEQAKEQYVAVDIGTLIKHGNQVLVSVFNAVRGDDLEQLHHLVKEHFILLDEQQRITRSALARLEAGVMRNLIQLEKQRYG
ncbi:hypothetical protein OO007_19215 [Cocleimonas sp. KMM 6892]|uniref:hypothetical protein n=1 Tax=unclassified Cocleimonas TaxID=2639732 RepID=UPI002DB86A55|nr:MULTISPECIES: hypothetical protein [unclassified Cocleimonas]MEB8434377.1 hypothetical protein [Cocleimonas sp. KMM 6892]MEC4717220.1 hypothetical protein [Cocleimonas sp. KMM 6895]MEC4746599.1 hypothetical protein [Cocleimonas sp. KMM 6896]